MKLKAEERVSMDIARQRALAYIDAERTRRRFYCNASSVAVAVWPDNQMRAQGAGAAASRILKALERDGLVRWGSETDRWGWQITAAGRAAVDKRPSIAPPAPRQ